MAARKRKVNLKSLPSKGRAENKQDDTKSLPSKGMAENKQDDPKSLPPKGMADFDKLKQYYEKFYKNGDVESCKNTITHWQEYRDKILAGTLSLEDFAGKYENGEKVKEYLVNYLAQDAAFVKSTQAESGGVTIFRGKDDAKGDYYKVSRKYTGDSEDTYFYGEKGMKKAEPYFKVCILSLLRLIVTAFDNGDEQLNPSDVNGFFPNENDPMFTENTALLDKMNKYKADLADKIFGLETLDTQSNDSITKDIALIEKIQKTKLYNDFRFKQLRLKIMNIESASGTCCDELKHRLLNIVAEHLIDDIYCDFFAIDPDEKKAKKKAKKESIAVKSYRIMKQAYEMFGIDEDKLDLSAQIGVYKTIWDIYYSKYDFSLDENTPNIIFYGSPGTGKTYTVNKYISQKSGNAKDKIVNVQCHPGFGYEEFIEGIKPLGITDSGAVKLGIVNGLFKDLCIEARKDMSSDYYFVADEINRANLSSMFGETLSKLEADYRDDPNNPENRQVTKTPLSTTIETYINENILNKNAATAADLIEQINNIRKMAYECDVTYYYNGKPYTCSIYDLEVIDDNKHVKVPYENGSDTVYGVISDKLKVKAVRNVTFGVPKNIRFIGMMNDVDKSIDSFDLALRRRFKWIKKRFDKSALIYSLSDKGVESGYIDEYVNACEKLNEYINKELGFGESYEFGHAYYMRIETSKDRSGDKVIIRPENCEALFANYLEPVLTEYIRSFKEETTIDELVNKAKEVFTEDIKSFIAPELLEDLMPGIDGDSLSSYCEACTMLNKFLTTSCTIDKAKGLKGLGLKKDKRNGFSIPILCEDFAEIKDFVKGNTTITEDHCQKFFEQNIKKKLKTYLENVSPYKMTGDSNSSKNKGKKDSLDEALKNAQNVFINAFTKAMFDSANADADDVNASKD